MMNAKRFFLSAIFVFGILSTPCLYAQDIEKSVQEIRKEYNLIKSQIASLEKDGRTGKLYCLHAVNNKYGKSYPAVGDYRTETWFYYAKEGNNPPQLRMVIENSKAAGKTTYFETLFAEDGELLFVFEQSKRDDIAKRLYCSDGKIIRYSENNVVDKSGTISEETIWIHRAAKAHKARFDFFHEVE